MMAAERAGPLAVPRLLLGADVIAVHLTLAGGLPQIDEIRLGRRRGKSHRWRRGIDGFELDPVPLEARGARGRIEAIKLPILNEASVQRPTLCWIPRKDGGIAPGHLLPRDYPETGENG
jgi:hypothetical protein